MTERNNNKELLMKVHIYKELYQLLLDDANKRNMSIANLIILHLGDVYGTSYKREEEDND